MAKCSYFPQSKRDWLATLGLTVFPSILKDHTQTGVGYHEWSKNPILSRFETEGCRPLEGSAHSKQPPSSPELPVRAIPTGVDEEVLLAAPRQGHQGCCFGSLVSAGEILSVGKEGNGDPSFQAWLGQIQSSQCPRTWGQETELIKRASGASETG